MSHYRLLHTSVKARVKTHTKSIWKGTLDLYGFREALQPYKTMCHDEDDNDVHYVLHIICLCCMLLQVKHWTVQ